jgi:hypothetical protein
MICNLGCVQVKGFQPHECKNLAVYELDTVARAVLSISQGEEIRSSCRKLQ